jgi:hypothetical protein
MQANAPRVKAQDLQLFPASSPALWGILCTRNCCCENCQKMHLLKCQTLSYLLADCAIERDGCHLRSDGDAVEVEHATAGAKHGPFHASKIYFYRFVACAQVYSRLNFFFVLVVCAARVTYFDALVARSCFVPRGFVPRLL